jgi:hypothetical protein
MESANLGSSPLPVRGLRITIEDAIARDLVPILFVTFTFGGTMLWLIVNSLAENWRKARVADREASLKQSMLDRGYRADEIAKVLNSGSVDS